MPTFPQQLAEAARLLETKGPEALNNPHAMIGRTCRCRDCFCCAAFHVYDAYLRARLQTTPNNATTDQEFDDALRAAGITRQMVLDRIVNKE